MNFSKVRPGNQILQSRSENFPKVEEELSQECISDLMKVL